MVSLERGQQLVEDVRDAIPPTWARTQHIWANLELTESLPAWQPHVTRKEWGDMLLSFFDETWDSLLRDIPEWRIYVGSTDRVALATLAERVRYFRRWFAEQLTWMVGLAETWGADPDKQLLTRQGVRELTMLVHWLTTLEDWVRKRRADLYRARLHFA